MGRQSPNPAATHVRLSPAGNEEQIHRRAGARFAFGAERGSGRRLCAAARRLDASKTGQSGPFPNAGPFLLSTHSGSVGAGPVRDASTVCHAWRKPASLRERITRLGSICSLRYCKKWTCEGCPQSSEAFFLCRGLRASEFHEVLFHSSTLPLFHPSTLPPFHPSTLPLFHSSTAAIGRGACFGLP
jgi:hypothetical protein